MLTNIKELKELVSRCLEIDELLDILGLDMFDLVDILENEIRECGDELEAACR